MKRVRTTSRALNKPLRLLGIDPKLIGISLAVVVIIIANNDGISARVIAGVVFGGLCVGSFLLGKFEKDPAMVLRLVWKRKAYYDPLAPEGRR